MRAMPYQTYLAERLQSAKGLGWDIEKTDTVQSGAVWINATRFVAECFKFTLSASLFRWFRLAK
jgi:hypothetical protein